MVTKTRMTHALMAAIAAGALTLAGCASAEPAADDVMEKDDAMEKTDDAMEKTDDAMMEDDDKMEVEGTLVTVSESDFAIELSQDTFAPGVYTFSVTNHGGTQHTLVIEGEGIEQTSTATLGSGDKESLVVDLPAGTYELWCSVGSHRGLGMSVTITVA